MGKLGLISCLAIASLISIGACALESAPDPSKNISDVSIPGNPEMPSASPNETTADESIGTTTGAVITPASCHVNLNFCNAPGSLGTDCTETGCSLSAAISSSKSIVASVGCSVLCNAVMRNSSGAVYGGERRRSCCNPKICL